MQHLAAGSRPRRRLVSVAVLIAAALVTSVAAAQSTSDPRAALSPGLFDAGTAASGIELLKNTPKPAGFSNPANPGDFGFVNSDLAFEGKHAFIGNFNGFQIYDISNPASPALVTTVVCPGGQGEVSVYGNLLFMSAEETRARTDCGAPSAPTGSPLRFRGVRIFDISNIAAPVQVAAVQTCRGSHTHTLLKSPHDAANLYVYVNGTGGVRSTTELASCKALPLPGECLSDDAAIRPRTVAMADRGDQGSARRARDRSRRQRPADHRRPGYRPDQHRSRTPRRPRCIPRARPGPRRRRRTPATTSRPSPRSTSRRAPARATGSCSTSATRPTRSGSRSRRTITSRTGTGPRSRTTARRSCSRTSGAAALLPAAARPTS